MSVLSLPRAYFKGFVSWNPNTGNNDDDIPTLDVVNVQLNWPFLKQFNITPDNYRQTFTPWFIQYQKNPNDPSSDILPCRWNYFGDNGCAFVNNDKATTLITGGVMPNGSAAASNDPLLSTPISFVGDAFGSSANKSQGKLVDIDPTAFWSSQIFFSSLTVGGGNASVSGPRVERMHSRWVQFRSRNYDPRLMIAGSYCCIFQTCIPAAQLQLNNTANSPLLKALYSAATAPGAQGLMIRYCSYTTLYMQNGILNDIAQLPRTLQDVSTLLQAGAVFMNPAYNRVVGAVGVWKEGEPVAVPAGRFLTAQQAVLPLQFYGPSGLQPPQGMTSGQPLGPVLAEVDPQARRLSLDLSNSLPEIDAGTLPGSSSGNQGGTKGDFGTITVGIENTPGNFTPLYTLGSSAYDRSAYEASAGIIDLPVTDGQYLALQTGQLALKVNSRVPPTPTQPASSQEVVALLEQPLTAEVSNRAIYLDQSQVQSFTVQVRYKGGLPLAGTQLLVAQYVTDPSGNPQLDLADGQDGRPAPLVQLVGDTGGSYSVDSQGNATVSIQALQPGPLVLLFYPYSGGQPPQVLTTLPFFFPNPVTPGASVLTVSNASYASVRVLPFDDSLPARFMQTWNANHDPEAAWKFLYDNVLYVYDMIYPVMSSYVPLGNRKAMEGAVNQLQTLIANDMNESTVFMPVTREMSAGKRQVFQMWIQLAQAKYPPMNLPFTGGAATSTKVA